MNRTDQASAGIAAPKFISDYQNRGFARIGQIDKSLLKSLRVEADRLLARPKQTRTHMLQFFNRKPYEHVVWTNPDGATIHYDLPGASPTLDQALVQLVAQPSVREALLSTLGSGYRLWWSQFRRAHEGSHGLRMHQDLPGQTTLSILLEDTPEPNGTTVLVPGSFRWAPVINSFPVVHPEHFGNRGQGLTGEAGSVYLFSPTTWHGRAGQPKRDQTVLMMSFLPAGSDAPLRTPGPEIFDGLPEPLQQLFSPAQTPEILPQNSELNQLLTANFPVSLGSPWRLMMGPAWLIRRGLRVKRRIAAKVSARREASRVPRTVIAGST